MYTKKQKEQPAELSAEREVVVATEERYYYHDSETPRIFTKDEEIPVGWSTNPGDWRTINTSQRWTWAKDKG